MLSVFLNLGRQALSEPREAAATLLSMGVPREAYWPAFFLLVVLSVLLNEVLSLISPAPPLAPTIPPIVMGLITAVISAVSIWAVWKVGQAMGGTGTFNETLLLTVFLQGILFAGQLVELVLLLAMPVLAGLFSLALVLFALWLNINFIATLHGFTSLWRAFGVLIMATLGVALALVFLMTLTGIGPGVVGAPNV